MKTDLEKPSDSSEVKVPAGEDSVQELVGRLGAFVVNGERFECRVIKVLSEEDRILTIDYTNSNGRVVQHATLPAECFIPA